MKKLIYFLFAFVLGINSGNANIIALGTAQTVAVNFYKNNSQVQSVNALLVYTETSTTGAPVYFVFNMNDKEGFVIVSAEDAGYPIIGYSTEGIYVIPTGSSNPNLTWWMQERKDEIEYLRIHNIQPDLEIANEWTRFANNNLKDTPSSVNTIPPLCTTKWGQGGYYNDSCPGNSLTGCVATAMSQIMKYWKYPAQGTGSSSYTSSSYGILSANYGATTYNWLSMPNSVNSKNNDVATIMYHCGVSVHTIYSPGGSGAVVLGNKPSAQYSFKTYFGYDPNVIQGAYRSNYTDPAWITLLKNDLDNGRPFMYGGFTTGNAGHVWVCDGYDASNKMHMNWGWSGSSDGYYSINSLNPSSYNFSQKHHVLIGIQPLALTGIASVNSSDGFSVYPNPFGDVTVIQFQLNTTDNITVKVYDIYGKAIKTLLNDKLSPGKHAFYWSGDDDVGNMVAVGMYFYTISTSSQFISKPMIFIDQ